MNEDTVKKYQFVAAVMIICICLAYIFIAAWHAPKVDLTAPVLSIITLLLGYYWGSSKSSQERSDMQTKKDSGQDATTKQAASDLTNMITKGA